MRAWRNRYTQWTFVCFPLLRGCNKQRVLRGKPLKQKLAKTAKANTERRAKFLWADLFNRKSLFFIYNIKDGEY